MQRYATALGLLTDLYQITMAYGYWRQGKAEQQAVFHWFYRRNPFAGDFVIACGLAEVMDLLENWHFAPEDLAYLSALKGNDGEPLFEAAFVEYLGKLRFTGSLSAVEEGTVVFPHEPLMRIEAPLIQGQLLETALLSIMNFQSLVATKSARVVDAARGDSVLEFGLRRAQSIDGGLSASRAAYIGGANATSNVLAGRLFDIPVRGTHAHSWVMSFDTEQEAFEKYAATMPNNCVFLVDTYDTIQGVQHAIEVGRKLRERGYELQGIRLDSGDLVALSRAARKMLDEAGFSQAAIVASDDLNEYRIAELKDKGAAINVWGVGTQLVTAYDQPALGGVYKLAALFDDETQTWAQKIKLSENPVKVSTPGILQLRRYYQTDGKPFGDMIWNVQSGDAPPSSLIQCFDGRTAVAESRHFEDLLLPIFVKGERQYSPPSIHSSRERARKQVAMYRSVNFALYPQGLEQSLNELKLSLIGQRKVK